MLEYNKENRFNVDEINKNIYHFKSKKEFSEEFDFNNGIFLGEGAFGTVKKCYSKIDKKDYAIKYVE